MKMWASKKGFTIVELLVTIVVIGILAGITIVSYAGIQKTSRDTERGGDSVTLKVAIEKYYAQNSQYPDVCVGGDDTDCPVTALKSVLAPYIESIPHDPVHVVDSVDDYRYIRGSTSSPNEQNSYGLKLSKESAPVCKTGKNMKATWWSSSVPNC